MNDIFLGCISDEQGVTSCVLLEYALSICKPVSTSIHQNDIYYTFFTMLTQIQILLRRVYPLTKKDKKYSLKSYS